MDSSFADDSVSLPSFAFSEQCGDATAATSVNSTTCSFFSNCETPVPALARLKRKRPTCPPCDRFVPARGSNATVPIAFKLLWAERLPVRRTKQRSRKKRRTEYEEPLNGVL